MADVTEPAVDLDADRAIMAFLRTSRNGVDLDRSGPFCLRFAAATKLPFLNYAIPDDSADPSALEIEALIEAFRRAGRTPRLEFLPSVAPALEEKLIARGFTAERRLPVMTCTPSSVEALEPPIGTRLNAPDDDATLFAFASLQRDAFGDSDPVDAGSVLRLRNGLERGCRALVAVDSSTLAVVGAAQTVIPGGGATEVVGVAVAPSHRRRGIAAAIVSALASQCFDAGLITVFLEAAPGADGAYRHAGFQRTSTSLHISLMGDSDA
jgi:ribosomal protein S18 acetylase RimI-like enzyme